MTYTNYKVLLVTLLILVVFISAKIFARGMDEIFATDAAAALKWLREESGLPISKSGYLGHSEGTIKALMATKIEQADFMILLAGGLESNAVGFDTSSGLIARLLDKCDSLEQVDRSESTQKPELIFRPSDEEEFKNRLLVKNKHRYDFINKMVLLKIELEMLSDFRQSQI